MNTYGFVRTAAAVPVVKVADTSFNTNEICALAEKAYDKKVTIAVFPELCITGSTCGDLFGHTLLVRSAEESAERIAAFSKGRNMVMIVGAPVPYAGRLYNCSIVIRDGRIAGIGRLRRCCIRGRRGRRSFCPTLSPVRNRRCRRSFQFRY